MSPETSRQPLRFSDPAVVSLWSAGGVPGADLDVYSAWRSGTSRLVLRVNGQSVRPVVAERPPWAWRFDWGSRSRGTLLLARSLLADATTTPVVVEPLAQLLAAAWLASCPREGFVMPVEALRCWAADHSLQRERSDARQCN